MTDRGVETKEVTGGEVVKPETKKRKPPQQPLSERIAHDLTYVSDQTGEQVEAWQWVKEQFEGFRSHIFNTLEHTTLPARFTQTDEFTLYTFSARLAERWANAAIARDWKAGFEFDPNATSTRVPFKVGIIECTSERANSSFTLILNVHIYFLGVSNSGKHYQRADLYPVSRPSWK